MKITLIEEEALPASQGLTRVHLEIRLPRPAWGALNVTGPVVAWSIAEEPPQVRLLVKGTLQGQCSPHACHATAGGSSAHACLGGWSQYRRY